MRARVHTFLGYVLDVTIVVMVVVSMFMFAFHH